MVPHRPAYGTIPQLDRHVVYAAEGRQLCWSVCRLNIAATHGRHCTLIQLKTRFLRALMQHLRNNFVGWVQTFSVVRVAPIGDEQ